MSAFIAADVGGTQLRAASYPAEGLNPIKIDRISTSAVNTTPLERLIRLIRSVWPEDEEVTSLGLAAPGPLNPFEGIIYTAPNIPGWENLPLAQHLEREFTIPVFLGNDANLAALAEWSFGAGRGHNHLIYLTVSTGIGGGVIVDGKLLLGAQGLAAEMGHTTVVPDGPQCGCGKKGHLEAVASGTAIARWAGEQLAGGRRSEFLQSSSPTTKELAAAAQSGDELAIAAFNRAGYFIGVALASFLHIFNPTIVIFGGGVLRSGDLILGPIRAALKERVISPQYLKNLTVTTAELGDEVGLLGALALARSAFQDGSNRSRLSLKKLAS